MSETESNDFERYIYSETYIWRKEHDHKTINKYLLRKIIKVHTICCVISDCFFFFLQIFLIIAFNCFTFTKTLPLCVILIYCYQITLLPSPYFHKLANPPHFNVPVSLELNIKPLLLEKFCSFSALQTMLKHLPQIAAHLWLGSIEPVCILLPIILPLAWFPTKTEHSLTLITSAYSQIHHQDLYIKNTAKSLHFPCVVCTTHWSNTNTWNIQHTLNWNRICSSFSTHLYCTLYCNALFHILCY